MNKRHSKVSRILGMYVRAYIRTGEGVLHLSMKPICRQKIKSFQQAGDFIYFYNHECIQLKVGEAPLSRRLSV